MTKSKRKSQKSEFDGYVSLYHMIKIRLSEQNYLLSTVMIWFAPGYILVNLAFVLALTYLTIQDPIPSITFGLYLLVLVIFVILMFVTFISLALVGSKNSEKYVKRIVTWMIFNIKSPFQNRLGLIQQELSVIKEIAQSEQGAADWRGTYVNIMVIGAIGFLWGAGTISAKWFSENLPANFQVQSLFTLKPVPTVFFTAIGWSIACVLANIVGAKLLNYLHDFLISEFSNRAIVYACLEAGALLKNQNILQNEVLNISNKKSIAGILGYSVVSKKDKEWKYLSSSVEYFLHDGVEMALIDDIERDKIKNKLSKEQEMPVLRSIAITISSWYLNIRKNLKSRFKKKSIKWKK